MHYGGESSDVSVSNPYVIEPFMAIQSNIDLLNNERPLNITFDMASELIWISFSDGTLRSYYTTLEKHTSVKVSSKTPLKNMVTCYSGVISYNDDSCFVHARNGLQIANLFERLESGGNIESIALMGMDPNLGAMDPSRILLGSNLHELHTVDFSSGFKETRKIPHASLALSVGHRVTSVGGEDGSVSLLDHRSDKIISTLKAFSSHVSSLSQKGDTLMATGKVERKINPYDLSKGSTFTPDPMVKVFDLRMYRQFTSLPFHAGGGPLSVNFFPGMSCNAMVLTLMGGFQIFDPMGDGSNFFFDNIDTQGFECVSSSISSSGHLASIVDASGFIHLWGTYEDALVNPFSVLEVPSFPEEIPPKPLVFIEHTYPFPASKYVLRRKNENDTPLLSDFDTMTNNRIIRPKHKHVLKTSLLAKAIPQRFPGDFLTYFPNPNLGQNSLLFGVGFDTCFQNVDPRNEVDTKDQEEHIDLNVDTIIPQRFRPVKVKLSKLGISDFNFSLHNKTPFVGLENALPNSYCNSVLQMFFLIPEVRLAMKSHHCMADTCLCCELGFLFHMLDQAKKQSGKERSVQATNFQRALRLVPESTALGLIEPTDVKLTQRAQNLNQFLLEHFYQKDISLASSSFFSSLTISESPSKGKKGKKGKNNKESKESSKKKSVPLQSVAPTSIFDSIFGANVKQKNKCTNCGSENFKVTRSSVLDLQYSSTDVDHIESIITSPQLHFGDLLKDSLCKRKRTRAWCDKCKDYFSILQTKSYTSLPSYLSINSTITEKNHLALWKQSTEWLPSRIKVTLSTAGAGDCVVKELDLDERNDRKERRLSKEGTSPVKVRKESKEVEKSDVMESKSNKKEERETNEGGEEEDCEEEEEEEEAKPPPTELEEEYQLFAVISHIFEGDKKGHLVLHSWTSDGYGEIEENKVHQYHPPSSTSENGQWIFFNDFAVSNAPLYEVLRFGMIWRAPCVIMYRKVIPPSNPSSLFCQVEEFRPPFSSPSALLSLFNDPGLGNQSIKAAPSYVKLSASELPGAGEKIAIDAEFVSLSEEEAEIKSDGRRVILQEGRLSLARVSVMNERGVTFIDDYIVTPEPIVDYLTRFSGIFAKDLDPSISPFHLVPLKAAYSKLKCLVDRGCIFIGHGLNKDFRIINLYVPPEQVIDTVDLFHRPHQRKISLKFLAAYLLGMDIQGETHDSIEDAKTALLVYNKYLELKASNTFDKVLSDIYTVGNANGWKSVQKDDI